MRIEEAIQILKKHRSLYESDITSKYDELMTAIDMACETLEKQIPKKLPIVGELYHCPYCNERNAILQGDNYCFNCGQALDWSDENDRQ